MLQDDSLKNEVNPATNKLLNKIEVKECDDSLSMPLNKTITKSLLLKDVNFVIET